MKKKKEEEYTAKEHIRGIIFILIIIAIIWIALRSCGNEEIKEPLTPAEQRQERIEQCFSAWDGSHIELTKLIKESMNDPDSYEHIETRYWDKDSVLFIVTSFRGKNAFGGVIKQTISAYCTMGCIIYNIEEL